MVVYLTLETKRPGDSRPFERYIRWIVHYSITATFHENDGIDIIRRLCLPAFYKGAWWDPKRKCLTCSEVLWYGTYLQWQPPTARQNKVGACWRQAFSQYSNGKMGSLQEICSGPSNSTLWTKRIACSPSLVLSVQLPCIYFSNRSSVVLRSKNMLEQLTRGEATINNLYNM